MGSTGHYITSDPAYKGKVKDYIDYTINSTWKSIAWSVLASATRGGVYYAAVERLDRETGDRKVLAVVQPYSFCGKGFDRQLVVKDQDETMGPYDYECPAHILDLLTETDSEYALQWRAKARAYNELPTSPKNVREGSTLIFEHPVSFGRYGDIQKFVVTEWGRRKRFMAFPDNGIPFRCRMSRDVLKYRTFTVENA